MGRAESQSQGESLSSRNDGPAKAAVLAFVRETTDRSSAKYFEQTDRILMFDQDNSLGRHLIRLDSNSIQETPTVRMIAVCART
jgi:hypothetical protein